MTTLPLPVKRYKRYTTKVRGGQLVDIHGLVSRGSAADLEHLAQQLDRDKGGGVNQQDELGRTPLHVAIEHEEIEMIKLLVADAQTNLYLTDCHKRTPLHTAVTTGRYHIVKSIVSMSQQLANGEVDFLGPNNRTPLHLAVLGNHSHIVELLLRHGANPLSPDQEAWTPVGIAAQKGSVDVLDVMFRLEIDFPENLSVYTNKQLLNCMVGEERASLLHLAVQSGNTKLVTFLLHQRIDTRCRMVDGSTAMHVACRDGILPMIKLLALDPWLIHAANFNNVTPLHEAAINNHCAALMFLLEKDADSEALTIDGLTGLLVAAAAGSLKTLQLLMSQKVNLFATDENQSTVIHYAIGHTKVLKELMEAIPEDSLRLLINMQDAKGHTALHHVAHRGYVTNVKKLLEFSAQSDIVDSNGVSALALAAAAGHLEIVDMLIDHGPRVVNEKDFHGRTPLHICCQHGHAAVAKHLAEKGAKLLIDADGRTPFHYAAKGGSVECMKHLLRCMSESEQEIDKQDHEKSTPLHMAAHYNHPKIITLLLDWDADISNNLNQQNPLDVAIAENHELAALAFISHERWEDMMTAISMDKKIQLRELVIKMPNVALVLLDKCVTVENENSENEMVTYDFTYLQGVTSDEQEMPIKRALTALEAMMLFDRQQCLTHPLCVSFLNAKWMPFGAMVAIGNMFTYIVYVVLLTYVVVTFPTYSPVRSLQDKEFLEKLERMLRVMYEEGRHLATSKEIYDFCYNHWVRWLIVASAFTGLAKELLPIFYQGISYLKRLSNVIEIVVYVLTLLYLDPFLVMVDVFEYDPPCPKIFWEAGAVAVFLAWLNLLLYVRRLPRVGLYVVMLVSMVQTMLKLLFVVSLFVAAFALSFYMLLSDQRSFYDVGKALMRVIVMMVGDLDYDEIIPVREGLDYGNITELCQLARTVANLTVEVFGRYHVDEPRTAELMRANCNVTSSHEPAVLPFPIQSYILFVTFCLLMIIVVLNVLIGLAVGDIKNVLNDATMQQIRMQVQLVIDLENALPMWFLKRFTFYKHVHYRRKEKKPSQLIVAALRAAQGPEKMDKTRQMMVDEIRTSQQHLEEWLNSLTSGLDKQMLLLKHLAVAVKRVEMRFQELEALPPTNSNMTPRASITRLTKQRPQTITLAATANANQ